MKKLINLVVATVLIALVIPLPCQALTCCQSVTWIRKANCDSYWHKVKVGTGCALHSSTGLGKWSWGSKTEVVLGPAKLLFTDGNPCQSWGTGSHTIRKSDWCSPSGETLPGPGSSGSRSGSAPRPIDLPQEQPYLLFDDGQTYCYTITKTPILGDAEDAWCKFGSAPEGINDFCLQPNYQDLFGCTLSNYNVRRPSVRLAYRYQ